MKKKILIIAFCLVSFMMIASLLCSCGDRFVQKDIATGRERINSGKYVIVILRIIGETDGEPVMPQYGLAVGTFETGGEVLQNKFSHMYPLSAETMNDGWSYMLLEPGLQYLAVQDVFTDAHMFKKAPTFKIDIPSNTPIVYIGTLHIPCAWEKVSWNKQSRFIEDKIDVVNEEDKARELAAGFLQEYGVPKTILMQRHKGPKIFRNPQKTE